MFSDFLSLFFPLLCESCEKPLVKGENVICSSCLLILPRTQAHVYSNKKLQAKFYGKLDIKHTYSFLYFKKFGPVQNLLHSLKYRKKPHIGSYLGRLFATELKKEEQLMPDFDIIIPVPLHRSRQRRRGYNQSEQFSNGISEVFKIPVNKEALLRVKKSATQTKKTRLERWENVKDIFLVAHPDHVVNKKILLVDDVITTGATVEACATKLYESGAREISVIAIAMAV